MTVSAFGRLPGGEEVLEIALRAHDVEVAILTYGAVIRDLALRGPDGRRPVVLGFERLDDYLADPSFYGAVVGRCANRIADGRFELAGETVRLDLNENGTTHLHGGSGGIWSRVWTPVEVADDRLVLELVSADGDQGYPGTVRIRCTYAVEGQGRLSIDLEATSDRPTPVNLATHGYFDLDRGETVLDHLLTVPADAVTPVDDRLVPTGDVTPVEGTALDFRVPRRVGDAGGDLDLNYVLAAAPVDAPRLVARLEGPRSGLVLEIHSTEPGLQVYDGNMMGTTSVFADGRRSRRHLGMCLEPQRYPDAVHHPMFPSVILSPGETYRQRTEYRLAASAPARPAGKEEAAR